MGQFTANPCGEIRGLLEITSRVFGDERGYFTETYHQKEFERLGILCPFVQDNQSGSTRGVLRGLHFQKNHPQGKLVRVLVGEVYDVAVDLRPGSPTYGKWHGVTLSAKMKNQFYIPAGFAHGFYVLSEKAEFAYKCTDYYHPEDEGGLAYDDLALGIDWPIPAGTSPILSEKDRHYPSLRELRQIQEREGWWKGVTW